MVCGALFGLPLLLLQNTAAHAARVASAASAVHHGKKVYPSSHLSGVELRSHLVAYQKAATATTTALPTTTTTTAPALATTTTVPPTTTTTQPPPPPTTTTTTTTTTTAPPPVDTSSEVGDATWYAEAPDGYCASPTLPFGTVLTVTNNDTGASTTCTVDDREAAGYPHVVDMSPEGFSQLAPLGQGVMDVTIAW